MAAIKCEVGVQLEVELDGGTWYPATVAEVGEQRIRIHITGWGDNTDKWEPARSKRLRLAGATRGRIAWDESSLRLQPAEGGGAAAAASGANGSANHARDGSAAAAAAAAARPAAQPGSKRRREDDNDSGGRAAAVARHSDEPPSRGIIGPPVGAAPGKPEEWPGRKEQIALLDELLCGPPGPAIFVHGPPSTGKTGVVHDQLFCSHDGCPVDPALCKTVFVDCVECSSQRALFDCILSQLPAGSTRRGGRGGGAASAAGGGGRNRAGGTPWVRSQTGMGQLLEVLREVCFGRRYRITMVFDRAERLRDMDPGLLAAMLGLNELLVCGGGDSGMSKYTAHACGQPDLYDAPQSAEVGVDVILVSENEWRTFRSTELGTGLVEPAVVAFPAYSKEDLLAILVMNWQADSEAAGRNEKIEQDEVGTKHAVDILKPFVRLMLEIFYPVCRDLLELQRLLREMLPKVVTKQMHE